ncbi:hypothetical protein EBR96_04210 [bacterium]|nr:hypothetical protein [bacterium]
MDGGEQLAALLKDIALRGKDAQKVRAGRLAVQTGMDFLSAGAVVGSIACGLGSLPGLAFSCSVAAAKRTMNSVVPKVYAAEQKEITKDVITLSKLTLDVQEKLAAGKPLDGKDEEVVRFVIRDLNLGDKASARLTTPVTQAELDKFMTITYDNIMQQLRY